MTLDSLARQPTSGMSEDDLVRGYSGGLAPVVRIMPCACGGILSADQGSEASVLAAVWRHNETLQHRRWRAYNDE